MIHCFAFLPISLASCVVLGFCLVHVLLGALNSSRAYSVPGPKAVCVLSGLRGFALCPEGTREVTERRRVPAARDNGKPWGGLPVTCELRQVYLCELTCSTSSGPTKACLFELTRSHKYS